ncbi:MAG: F0F1 ATP synthase subunit A [Rhodospirillales bacterium]|nr:F0F1 ATP synthase subunit A [Rhodospirillales bacterium]
MTGIDAAAGTWLNPAVLATIALSMAIAAFALALGRRAKESSRTIIAAETLLLIIERELATIFDRDPRPFLPLLATLFLFILFANISAVIPGVRPPTEFPETAAALAAIVFGAVQWYGVRTRGFVGYLRHFAQPSPILLPFHIAAEFTRTLSLAVRLFGNMMSHGLVLAVVASIAGLLVPVPFLALGLLIGAVQAYIFTVLAAVYIAAAVAEPQRRSQ